MEHSLLNLVTYLMVYVNRADHVQPTIHLLISGSRLFASSMLTLVLLNPDMLANSVDPDQLASEDLHCLPLSM